MLINFVDRDQRADHYATQPVASLTDEFVAIVGYWRVRQHESLWTASGNHVSVRLSLVFDRWFKTVVLYLKSFCVITLNYIGGLLYISFQHYVLCSGIFLSNSRVSSSRLVVLLCDVITLYRS